MKNVKNIAKGILVLALLAGGVYAAPVSAEEGKKIDSNSFINAKASLKADALIKLESAVGVVLGPNNTLRVMGAKVTSVASDEIKATAAYGNSSLNFVVKVDGDTKLNGGKDAAVSSLKAGDKISFAGVIASSTSSSVVVDADHVVSQALARADKDDKDGREDKDAYKGEIKAVNTSDSSLSVALKSGRTVKVVVSSSTIITLDGAAKALSALHVGDEVKIEGSANADGSVITATKIVAESEDADDSEDDSDDEEKDEDDKKEGRGGWLQKIRAWFANR